MIYSTINISIVIGLSIFLISEKAIATPYHTQNGITASKTQSKKLQNYSAKKKSINRAKKLRNLRMSIKTKQKGNAQWKKKSLTIKKLDQATSKKLKSRISLINEKKLTNEKTNIERSRGLSNIQQIDHLMLILKLLSRYDDRSSKIQQPQENNPLQEIEQPQNQSQSYLSNVQKPEQSKLLSSNDDRSSKTQQPQNQSRSHKGYTVIIAADPQPWRLTTGDPNSTKNRDPWIRENKKVAQALKSHKADFIIVNGDLTEYGRKETYDSYANIYKNLGVPVYEGLGNHDYANNAHDCIIPWKFNFFADACAISAVERMIAEMKKYKKSLSNFSQDLTEKWLFNGTHLVKGSLSYSWDHGDIHYVQLHNYPLYEVHLNDRTTSINIKNSLNWLKKDLEAADKRGKVTILNFHDARPYFKDKNSHFLHPQNAQNLAIFKSIITAHNVKAIFVGHVHSRFYCRAQDDKVFGNIPVYTAGALFRGSYYLIKVEGKNIHVEAYNESNGKPILYEDLGLIGNDTKFSESCSRL
ncbi:metallophosphoesterase [Bartonella sp. B1099]|uniref:metallophosphoesterase n=1 Tax=Bartonella sp. B1099 TaxID=2911422 RepID=UPI003531EFA0